VREPVRNFEQNKKMWAMLHDVSKQVKWPVNGAEGFLDANDWKDIFTASLTKHQRVAQGIEGGWVMLGTRTSKMSKSQMAELIEYMYAFGANHSVTWTEIEETA
jgi:hypothetical protein